MQKKTFDRVQHPCTIKAVNKLSMKKNVPQHNEVHI